MDVKALYPSIKKEMAAQAIEEAMTKSKLEWKNIDMKYITRYVSLTVDKETIDKHDLSEVIPKPKSTTTLHSFVNPSSKSRAKATDGDSQFDPPERNPTAKEREKLIGHWCWIQYLHGESLLLDRWQSEKTVRWWCHRICLDRRQCQAIYVEMG